MCVEADGLLGTTTSLSVSESAISSMTLSSTVNRSARTTASAPCNASRLSTATSAASPISAASVRADSRSALERRRVSPPEASRRAMAVRALQCRMIRGDHAEASSQSGASDALRTCDEAAFGQSGTALPTRGGEGSGLYSAPSVLMISRLHGAW